ncbi:uncharacterized protein B0H18DRAFT_1128614 [Fomitopsis serialis]|uniref:uncharacterized protein n=1 Tax=Fomitopsis serialis TaxID=139415 RepID=UPI0020073F60|nr:uncharacterized protein B0H18DRAFT_1128614 [Neoantrodia serialis]KAH9911508.1 hypothetical protein B0H18DRAFT_1128614 [Neoantrodia serialis]
MARGPAKYAYKLRRPSRKTLQQHRQQKLTAEEVKELARLMQTRFCWSTPTGSGKTAIAAGPHLWPTNEGKTTIMVCPLLALEEEMVETFKTEFGLTAIAVNGQNTLSQNRQIMQEILQGQYRIILISPEMLQSSTFKDRILCYG